MDRICRSATARPNRRENGIGVLWTSEQRFCTIVALLYTLDLKRACSAGVSGGNW